MALVSRLIQRHGAGLIASIDIGAFFQQQIHQLPVPAVCGQVQRRCARVIGAFTSAPWASGSSTIARSFLMAA
jgi:hypothetical protein